MARAFCFFLTDQHPAPEGTAVRVMMRVEGPGPVIGDVFQAVAPGEELFGHGYEEWAQAARSTGELEL